MNYSHSVFRCVHVSATKYVHIKEGQGEEMLAKRNDDFFFFSYYYIRLKVRE